MKRDNFRGRMMIMKNDMEVIQLSIYCDIVMAILKKHKNPDGEKTVFNIDVATLNMIKQSRG